MTDPDNSHPEDLDPLTVANQRIAELEEKIKQIEEGQSSYNQKINSVLESNQKLFALAQYKVPEPAPSQKSDSEVLDDLVKAFK